jgi:hypothetical protein
VLAVYILVVISHCCWSMYTGMSSAKWGSPSEIAALAFRSEPTDAFDYTGAGIKTITVYEENIKLGTKLKSKPGAEPKDKELVLFLSVRRTKGKKGTEDRDGNPISSPKVNQLYS